MTKEIRNIAIIAHVDHGKTTLVDTMLRQSGMVGTKPVSARFSLLPETKPRMSAMGTSLVVQIILVAFVVTLPLLSPTQDAIATRMSARAQLNSAGVAASFIPHQRITANPRLAGRAAPSLGAGVKHPDLVHDHPAAELHGYEPEQRVTSHGSKCQDARARRGHGAISASSSSSSSTN